MTAKDILEAAKNGDLKLVQWLVSFGADVNAEDENGCSVLHYAVNSGNPELVQWLVEQGAHLNERSSLNSTGYISLVQWLVKQSADINERNSSRYFFRSAGAKLPAANATPDPRCRALAKIRSPLGR